MSKHYVVESLRLRLGDTKFYAKLDDLARKLGYKNGLADIVEEDLSKVDILARMMAYVLMNKIVFYKVLEGYYELPELKPFSSEVKASSEYLNRLNDLFKEAIKTTGDFEQIFETGLYDHIVLADRVEALELIDDLIRTLSAPFVIIYVMIKFVRFLGPNNTIRKPTNTRPKIANIKSIKPIGGIMKAITTARIIPMISSFFETLNLSRIPKTYHLRT